jgi:hypothetical protein
MAFAVIRSWRVHGSKPWLRSAPCLQHVNTTGEARLCQAVHNTASRRQLEGGRGVPGKFRRGPQDDGLCPPELLISCRTYVRLMKANITSLGLQQPAAEAESS